MNRKIVGVVAAVALAALGTFGIVRYVQAAEERALAGERPVEVLVVREAVAPGTPAEEIAGAVETERVPAKVRAEDAVDALADLDGKVSLVGLVPGEQVVATRFGTTDTLAQQSGVDVPDGYHLTTLKLAPERAVGGQVRAGDLVAVAATFDPFEGNGADGNATPNATHILLHKVLVTDVVSNSTPAEGEGDAEGPAMPDDTYFVTLAVDAPSVERLLFAAEEGRVWLTAEPESAPEDGTSVQTRESIFADEPAG